MKPARAWLAAAVAVAGAVAAMAAILPRIVPAQPAPPPPPLSEAVVARLGGDLPADCRRAIDAAGIELAAMGVPQIEFSEPVGPAFIDAGASDGHHVALPKMNAAQLWDRIAVQTDGLQVPPAPHVILFVILHEFGHLTPEGRPGVPGHLLESEIAADRFAARFMMRYVDGGAHSVFLIAAARLRAVQVTGNHSHDSTIALFDDLRAADATPGN
jgi:hypothetical protein